jgi:hypothetical protein
MPQKGTIFRALVASPSDCVPERKIIPEVIADWNAVHSLSSGAIIEPVLWETHSRPAFGDRPQALINQQLVVNCDLVIGAFWTKLGTPTGKAESGTAEEIEQFRAAGKPVLLYFSSAPVVPESLDAEQYQALNEYKKRLGEQGLYWKYESLSEFRRLLQRHLAGQMIDLLKQVSDTQGKLTADLERKPENKLLALQQFYSRFESFLRRIQAEWEAERDSDPISTDDGKYILSRAADELLIFKSAITEDTSGLSQALAAILKRLRALQRHQTYLDGGASFQKFWDTGDSIILAIKGEVFRVREAIDTAQQSAPTGSVTGRG